MYTANETVSHIREASRLLVRELGFMSPTLAGTEFSASAVHAIIEIGHSTSTTASSLSKTLNIDRSNVSRVLAKLVEAGAAIEAPNASDGRQKILSITDEGKQILGRIDMFANEQVMKALERLPSGLSPIQILDGIRAYALALRAQRLNEDMRPVEGMVIISGYRPGLLGRCLEMHMQYYSRAVGFGASFEGQLATGLGDLLTRLDSPKNEVWVVTDGTNIYGTVFIDGEGLGENKAHLRAFIMDDALRGRGLGRKLIDKAMAFVDDQAFAETHLYTFRGLDGKFVS
jgi:DNA-binding MarR family transcriptional regulator